MYGLKIKNYASDLKGIFFLLGIVIAVIIWKWDYLFSQETMNQVKMKPVEIKEVNSSINPVTVQPKKE